MRKNSLLAAFFALTLAAQAFGAAPSVDDSLAKARFLRAQGDVTATGHAYQDALAALPQNDTRRGNILEELVQFLVAEKRFGEVSALLSPLPATAFPQARRLHAEALEAQGLGLEAVLAYAEAEAAADVMARDEIAIRTRSLLDRLSEKDLATLAEKKPLSRQGAFAALRLSKLSAERGQKEAAKPTLERVAFLFPNDTVGKTAEAQQAPVVAQPSTEGKPGHFGLLLPLSGRLAPLGEKVLRGALLGFHLLAPDAETGFTVHLADTQSDPAAVANALASLVSQGVVGVIGPLKGDEAQAGAQAARPLGLPLVAITPATDVAGAGVFRLQLREEDEVDAVVRQAKAQGIRRFAILAPDTDQGRHYRNLFWDAAVHNEVEIAGSELFTPAENTIYSLPISKLAGTYNVSKDELRERFEADKMLRPTDKTDFSKYKPRAIVDFGAVFIPASSLIAAQIAPQFPYYDVSNVRLLGLRSWNYGGFVQVGKQYVEGSLFPAEWSPATPEGQAFLQAYQAAYGEAPGALEAYGFDAAALMAAQWKQGAARTRGELGVALARLKDFPAATGPLTTTPGGDIAATPKIFTVERQQIVPAPIEARP